MNGSKLIVSAKYATAFLNVFINELSPEVIERVRLLGNLLSKNKELTFFLGWPVVNAEVKVKALHGLIKDFSLGQPFFKLIALLGEKERFFLIGEVLKQVCRLYAIQKNIAHFTIASSHELTVSDCTNIQQFLAKMTGASIIYDYKVDKNLIAGIRLQSKTYLWQHSIRKQLDDMKLSLIR